MRRRTFLSVPAISLAPVPLAGEGLAQRLYAYGDGVPHTPHEYATLLAKIAERDSLVPDEFSRGGVVEKLELRMAALLGKEAAVWLPTGTLANHLAIRLLAGQKKRVIVQAQSHLYRDCGDCAQTLSGLHLLPLGGDQATFSVDEVERAASDSVMGRVVTPIGAMQIETPVRRKMGEQFDFKHMLRITKWAREQQVGLHLDGARLFIESAYTGRGVKEYASLFDTVYISLYKYFNAANGAILAGPKSLLADLYHTRRMFGGGIPHSWPSAAVALHYIDDFQQTFKLARQRSEDVISELSKDSNFDIERVPNGTNVFRLRVQTVNAPVYQLRLEEAGISARAPEQSWLQIQVNASWARVPATEIVRRFRQALG